MQKWLLPGYWQAIRLYWKRNVVHFTMAFGFDWLVEAISCSPLFKSDFERVKSAFEPVELLLPEFFAQEKIINEKVTHTIKNLNKIFHKENLIRVFQPKHPGPAQLHQASFEDHDPEAYRTLSDSLFTSCNFNFIHQINGKCFFFCLFLDKPLHKIPGSPVFFLHAHFNDLVNIFSVFYF